MRIGKVNKVIIAILISAGLLAGIIFFGLLNNHHGQERNIYQSNQTYMNAPRPGFNGVSWNAPNGGEIMYAENLPSCQGTELFNSPPAAENTYDNISPLGQTSSSHGDPGHVFPVDHLYFNFKHTTPGDFRTPSLPATIFSPGSVEIFQISHTTYQNNGQVVGNDYSLAFAPCKEVTGAFGHINNVSAKIQNAIDHASQKSCQQPFTTGGGGGNLTFNKCNYSLLLPMKSGEEIGTAGGPGIITYAFDFGVYDMRIQSLPFIDQKYWTPQNLHSVCGLYYYPSGPVKTSVLNKIDNVKKDANGLPDCGTNMWDKSGTAQGNWVLPNTPVGMVPDQQGLSIIHLNSDPSQGLIDWGGTIAPADRLHFNILNNGVINRDPNAVKADGQVYCFQDTIALGTAFQRSIKLQLVDANTIKIEYSKNTCSSSPVLSNPTIYIR